MRHGSLFGSRLAMNRTTVIICQQKSEVVYPSTTLPQKLNNNNKSTSGLLHSFSSWICTARLGKRKSKRFPVLMHVCVTIEHETNQSVRRPACSGGKERKDGEEGLTDRLFFFFFFWFPFACSALMVTHSVDAPLERSALGFLSLFG